MKTGKSLPLAEVAILTFCVWLSRDLLNAWHHSPHDQLGWLALVIWLAPLAVCLAQKKPAATNAYFLGAAILTGLIGELVEFHFLGHAALALALAAWMPLNLRSALWLMTAAAWMPAFGWALGHCPNWLVLTARLALALAGAFSLWPVPTAAKKL